VYNDGFNNGHFGDLRQYVSVKPAGELDEKQIRKLADLVLDLSRLKAALAGQTGAGKPVKEVKITCGNGVQFSL
jgi:CRISPR-associated protein Csh2